MDVRKIITTMSAKALIVRINLCFLVFFLLLYAIILLCPSAYEYHQQAALLVKCSIRDCHHKTDSGAKIKAVLEEQPQKIKAPKEQLIKRSKPSFLNNIERGQRIAMVNMEGEDISEWEIHGQLIPIKFTKVSELFEWKHIFPEWIDEEEEFSGSSCPEIPMPEFEKYSYIDMIVAKLPCKVLEKKTWNYRDVFMLQVHVLVARLALKRGKWDRNKKMKVVFLSKCMPMVEIFRCEDMVEREGDWWYYRAEKERLKMKVDEMPIGSCALALPLWDKGVNRIYDLTKLRTTTSSMPPSRREAYATVLHTSESYVCGAITLAQSLLKTQTKRDLVLLLDTSISPATRRLLAKAGWTLRFITRIRNPHALKDSYNEYNYSKLRLWQLTDYDRVVFIDSDILVLRNLDVLFYFPQMSAVGNDGHIFNSGVMVIEPSNCTFRLLMNRTEDIVSYNGGDQGFLNEVFVYWHRLPRRVNFLKNFWSNGTTEASVKNQLFGSEPASIYALHYLGLKPWMCYRDYDCNWDVADQRVYASDVAHQRWWKLHDEMDEELKMTCGLSEERRAGLEWDRKVAGEMGFEDQHWRINVTDPRQHV